MEAGDAMSNPYLQLYPNDYLSEPSLIGVDYFDHGVWFHMMLLMCKSVKPGYLCAQDGSALTDEEVADRLPAGNRERVLETIRKLGDKKRMVFSRTEDGTIYSRRIIRDMEKRERFTEYGKKGGRPPMKGNEDVQRLNAAGLTITVEDWNLMRETFRGVDFSGMVGEAVAENKVAKIGNVARWFADRAEGMKADTATSKVGGWTLQECIDAGTPVGVSKEMAEEFYNHYAAVGWVTGAGIAIRSLPHALSKWKSNQAEHPKKKAEQSKEDFLAGKGHNGQLGWEGMQHVKRL